MALTPMMRQYQEIKEAHKDALLMFRLGDFYELFFEDAVTASRELEITLTGREGGETGRIPMCGVPYHAVQGYLDRLTDRGYRVAICEQVEDPKTTKGLVRREVVRVVTPGTTFSKETSNRFLAAVAVKEEDMGLAFVDVSTGEVLAGVADDISCRAQIRMWTPIEMIIPKGWQSPQWLLDDAAELGMLISTRDEGDESVVLRQYNVGGMRVLGLEEDTLATKALSTALTYILDTQKMALRHLQEPKALFQKTHLVLNQTAMHHLEITSTARDGSKKGSLFGLLDATMTAAGTRQLRTWLERPLCRKEDIERRHDAVAYFVQDMILRMEVRDAYKGVHDLARLVARFAFNSANARDLLALAHSLEHGRVVIETLSATEMPVLMRELIGALPDVSELVERIRSEIVDEPPVQTREGGMFREGVHETLDYLRHLQTSGRTWLRDLEQRERDKTGIKSLRVGYNKVFGYYIEVSKSNLSLVPDEYERRQTLASAERFILPELKEREADILSAEERAMAQEYDLFQEFRETVLEHGGRIQAWADALAQLDVLQSFAHVAAERRYVRPQMQENAGIEIEGGRHPVVEMLSKGKFVPNDTLLVPGNHMVLLTGPNMGGKSTYMRQTALIVLMAQMGGFVPAKRAVIGIVDQIFARIGAADDLGRGQSTFMVEMIELAEILRQSTSRSLVLLDEIGRGTSTYDGLSIAEAVLEELATRKHKPLTMFATHYHELIGFSERFEAVRNYSMGVQETQSGITFLHTVVKRPSDRSYGIQVARLAGLPEDVVGRAEVLLATREQGQSEEVCATLQPASDETDKTLFHSPYRAFAEQISEMDLLGMTPLEAMNRLNELIEKARELV